MPSQSAPIIICLQLQDGQDPAMFSAELFEGAVRNLQAELFEVQPDAWEKFAREIVLGITTSEDDGKHLSWLGEHPSEKEEQRRVERRRVIARVHPDIQVKVWIFCTRNIRTQEKRDIRALCEKFPPKSNWSHAVYTTNSQEEDAKYGLTGSFYKQIRP
jgi:hypothetical protein